MDRRKELTNEYKQRIQVGGVFRITNTVNGQYYLDYAPDLPAKKNAFDFMVSSGICFHHILRKDWEAHGGRVFVFEVVEEIKRKSDQTPASFAEDLQNLKQMWKEKLGTAGHY